MQSDKITSNEIKMGLKLAHSKGYQVFFEVGNDTGFKVKRHADAVAIGIWPSTGHQIHGFEIKISRGDFLNEMKAPEKSLPVFKHCHRWSLVTPPGLVKQDELPPNWGLMTYDGKTLRRVKHPPLLTPEPLSPGFVAALVRRAGEMDQGLLNAALAKEKAAWEASKQRVVEQAVSRATREKTFNAEERGKRLEAYEKLFGDVPRYEIEEMAPILNAIRQSGIARSYSGLESLANKLDQSSAQIKEALGDINLIEEKKNVA